MRAKILFVDDDPSIRALFRALLSDRYAVEEASRLDEARRLLIQSDFDLIVLDVTLPDGSGLDLCQEIRSDRRLRLLPILILSGGGREDKFAAFRVGADRHINKPYSPIELLDAIRELL